MKTIIKWARLARLPFHLAGILPFLAGSFLALKITGIFNPAVFLVALFALELILFSSNVNGEIFDIAEDTISAKSGKSIFSGGSGVIIEGKIPPKQVNIASWIAVCFALIFGLLLQFYFKTGKWTILLGLTGIITGFYYSRPPIRWAKRGLGEIFIAYSYSWLPMAVGYYLQTGRIDSSINWLSIPVASSIFNVILINEFLDFSADTRAGKTNLVVRLGKEKSAVVYVLSAIAGIITSIFSLNRFFNPSGALFYLPLGILSLFALSMVAAREFREKKHLISICLLTLLVNTGINLTFILAIFLQKAG